MDKDSAILQGAFLLSNKLCLPASLLSLQKSDWLRVGRPVVEAVTEICRHEQTDPKNPNPISALWKKKVVCVVWLKLLCRETGRDMEEEWRENPFFPLQYGFPEVSHIVLLELVKSTATADIFAQFLLRLPQPQIYTELERLIQHVKCDPTGEEDVQLLLDVWWELWKGIDEEKTGGDDSIEIMFARQFGRLSSRSGLSPQAAKRLKLDTLDQVSSPATDVLHILLHSLKDMKDQIISTNLCLQILAISLDSVYTSYLINHEVPLSPKEKMVILSKVVSIRDKKNEELGPELIRQTQRDLNACRTPSPFQLHRMKLDEALNIIIELARFWVNQGLLKASDCSKLSYSAFRLQQSVQRLLTALGNGDVSVQETEKDLLRGLLELLTSPDVEISPKGNVEIATIIISHCLEDYQDVAALFAEETTWVDCDDLWLDCLQKNQAAFQQHDILINLTFTLMNKLHTEGSDVGRCRKLMKVVADIFSALSLEDKNRSLAAMLTLSSKGFFGSSVPSAVTDGFDQELNMAFNCITQAGGEASQGNLITAASLVARVAFQNPEAALRSCCHSAVFNKGAFSLMAKILQQLPGLSGQRVRRTGAKAGQKLSEAKGNDEGKEEQMGISLISWCLQETLKTKSLSDSEKEQFLKFLSLLMMPVITLTEGEQSQSFLPPQEVVNHFVLPNISTVGHSTFDTELSVQLLQTALCVQNAASSPHWVLECCPFPLLYILAQLHDQALRSWEQPAESAVHYWSMDTKELLVSVLTTLSQVVGAEVAAAPSRWSRALFWLYNKIEELDWTVRFHLKPLWGEHFKNEVPSSLLTVCDLPEQEWSGLDLVQYGHGTGLLAWMECCSISDSLRSTMLSCLSLDQHRVDHVNMFSKGLLVALTQILPWCLVSQWSRLLGALRDLICTNRLHVPFSLEYVDYLPLLDLRRFSCELRLSVLLLRVFQLLCGSSCSHWLSENSWAHVGRLYAHAVREMIGSLRAKLPLPCPGALTGSASTTPKTPVRTESNSSCTHEVGEVPSQEVLFVLSQLFCHVQHIQVMIPGGQCEPLFLSSLEILSHYKTIMATFPDSSSPLESDNIRHFFSTITDNLENQEMKAALQQKIAQLVSSAA